MDSLTSLVDIKGLDKGKVLKVLHDGTRPLGMGFFQAVLDLSLEEARQDYAEVVARQGGKARFDYYYGRPLKVELSGDTFDPCLYDRDAGPGAAARAIANLRSEETGGL